MPRRLKPVAWRPYLARLEAVPFHGQKKSRF